MQNKLIVFDIDGTLTNTNDVDSQLFEKAILEYINVTTIDTQWHNYKYSTDTGIISEIIQSTLNRETKESDIELIKESFINYLSDAFANNSSYCLPIDGARTIFNDVTTSGWDIAIATGGWERSARLKLKTANIPHQSIPIAHSDDHIEREAIVLTAIQRAKKHYQKDSYSTIFYVGDRLWDKKAAKTLDIGFIGIGNELNAEARNSSFFHISDYTTDNLISYLSQV